MGHRTLARVLVAVGTFVAVVAIVAVWVSRQALETDQWTTTSSDLLEQPAVRTAVGDFLVDHLYANVDVTKELQDALPPRADALAGPAAGALRRGAEDVAQRALARPAVQNAWEQANRSAHQALVHIIEGGDTVSTQQGVVTLNLKTLLDEIVRRTGIGERVASRIPEDAASIEILRSDQLGSVQTIARVLKPLALVLVLLMLACFGGALALARGYRREMLRACGIGLIFAGAAALVVRSLAGNTIVDELAGTAAVKPAVAAAWDVGTSLLVGVAVATMAYGALAVIGAWLAGPTRLAVAVRAFTAPYVRDLRIAYGALAAVVLLVFAWGPTEGTRRVLPALLLIALTVAGFEVLRRQVAADFPDASRTGGARAALERSRAALRRPETAVAADTGAPTDGHEVSPAVDDDAIAQLERLDELHRTGALDDDEFAAAKNRVLTRT
jgi:hypothetical protein